MTDQTHDALYQAILANPADDLPRLVYADWLEEHTDRTKYAEFIRIQCELEQTIGTSETRYDALKKRERELWPMVLQYLPPLPRHRLLTWETPSPWIPDTNPPRWAQLVVSRGFVSTVRCELADWYGEDHCNASMEPNEDAPHPDCQVCHGTGHIGKVGPCVVRSHPITRVEITDQSPDIVYSGTAQRWMFRRWPEDDRGQTILPGYLPGELWDSPHLSIDPLHWGSPRGVTGPRNPLLFVSRENAMTALSDALLDWARKQEPTP